MDVRDLDRIGFVTRHFRELQGLRKQVPFGMRLLGIGLLPTVYLGPMAWRLRYWPFLLLVVVSLYAGSAALSFWSSRYYRNLFGEVEAQSKTTSSSYWMIFVLAGLVLPNRLAMGSLSLWRIGCVLCGSLHLAVWCRRGNRCSQGHPLLLGGLLLALAALLNVSAFGALERVMSGMASISPTLANLFNPAEQVVFCSVAGVSLILAGLLDHRQLVRTLGQPPPPEIDEAAVEAEEIR